jgi:hypothetical protein
VLQRLRGEPLLVGAVLAGYVAEADLGVGRLLRLEDLRHRIDALVRHLHDAESHFTAKPDRHVEPGHRVEDGGLT